MIRQPRTDEFIDVLGEYSNMFEILNLQEEFAYNYEFMVDIYEDY